MELNSVVEYFLEKPDRLRMGKGKLAKRLSKKFNTTIDEAMINEARKTAKFNLEWKKHTSPNILVIGDTHIPYEKEGYLEFCKKQYDDYDCNVVIHIGDLLDHHATSFHPSIPDAYSPGDEFEYSKVKLQEWYKTFPQMKVVRGNHDERPYRLAAGAKISSHWIKSFTEVLEVPNWEYEEFYEIADTVFTHGTGTSGVTAAYRRALNLGKNVVIGHIHSEASIIHHKLPNKTIYGMIVGCGVDENSYGMNYAKNFPKKSVISCAVIADGQPIIKIM